MDNKLLTISIAAYNVEKYLDFSLNSLLTDSEALKLLQILIVNDGSKDETLKIANNYARQYPDSIEVIDKINGGYGSTINESIRLAKGKYFKLLDGDDWYDSSNLYYYLKYLDKTNTDLVLTPYERIYEDGAKPQIMKRHNLEPEISYKMMELQSNDLQDIHMHELTVKTELLQRTDTHITEHCFYTDNEFVFIPMLEAETISLYDKVIYKYRIGNEGQSVSIEGRIKHYSDCERVIKKCMNLYLRKKNKLCPIAIEKAEKMIKDMSVFQYTNYFLCKSTNKIRNEVREFDRYLYNADKFIYNSLNCCLKELRFMRATKFYALGLIHVIRILKRNI